MNNEARPAVLSRPDAEVLYAQLEHKARRQVRRRSLLRQTGIASTAIVLAAVVAVVVSPLQSQTSSAYAFMRCGSIDPAYNSHPIQSLLVDVPAIALFSAYGGEAVHPEDVVAQCADQDENATGVDAIRLIVTMGGQRVILETWYVDPGLEESEAADSVALNTGAPEM